jgi:hypothetical protein
MFSMTRTIVGPVGIVARKVKSAIWVIVSCLLQSIEPLLLLLFAQAEKQGAGLPTAGVAAASTESRPNK